MDIFETFCYRLLHLGGVKGWHFWITRFIAVAGCLVIVRSSRDVVTCFA